jgi:hypothetical protein
MLPILGAENSETELSDDDAFEDRQSKIGPRMNADQYIESLSHLSLPLSAVFILNDCKRSSAPAMIILLIMMWRSRK